MVVVSFAHVHRKSWCRIAATCMGALWAHRQRRRTSRQCISCVCILWNGGACVDDSIHRGGNKAFRTLEVLYY
jgi:hypothetical protein